MNPRLNSVIFIVVASLANVVVMVLLFVVSFVLFARFLAPILPPQINGLVLVVLFVASVLGTYLLYHRAMRWASAKYRLEEKLGPIFRRGGPGSDRPPGA